MSHFVRNSSTNSALSTPQLDTMDEGEVEYETEVIARPHARIVIHSVSSWSVITSDDKAREVLEGGDTGAVFLCSSSL